MSDLIKIVKLLVVAFVICCALLLTYQSLFELLTQSPDDDNQLSFFNFILPGIITVGLMIYASIEIFMKRRRFRTIILLMACNLLLEILAIRWQISHLVWYFDKGYFIEVLPILMGVTMILSLFIKLISNFIGAKWAR